MLLVDKYTINNINQIEYNKLKYFKLFPHLKNKYLYKTSYNNFTVNYHLLNNKNKIIDDINDINNPLLLYKYLLNLNKIFKPYDLYDDLPNLLISGYSGSGKSTFIKLLLEEIYDKSINNTKKVKYSIVGYGNSNVEILIEQSDYHIIIEPNNSGFDKYIIQEIVKEYAKKYLIPNNDLSCKFKIILINNIDNLSYYAQTSLRCTMEKYFNSCKFILCGKQISKIIDPIRSRCLNISLSNPSNNDIFNIIYDIIIRENININKHNISKIIKYSNNNLNIAKWLLNLHLYNINDYNLSYVSLLYKIIIIIKDIYYNNKIITNSFTNQIRHILYTIFINNILPCKIINVLLDLIIIYCHDFDHILLQQIISCFAYYESRMLKGKRIIIHIEALINSILYHISNFRNL